MTQVNSLIPLSELEGALLEEVHRRLFFRVAPEKIVFRCRIPCEPFDPIPFLARQRVFPQMFFQSRHADDFVLGVGAAVELTHFGPSSADTLVSLRPWLARAEPGSKFFGGQAFDPQRIGSDWTVAGAWRYVLPRLEMGRDSDGYYAAIHGRWDRVDDDFRRIRGFLQDIDFTEARCAERSFHPRNRKDIPPKAVWTGMCRALIDEIRQGRFQKVVLARKTQFALPQSKIYTCFHNLHRRSEGCFRFLFRWSSHCSFLGASPERLFHRDGECIETEALAGTIARGLNPDDDMSQQSRLRRSLKDQKEHALVVNMIETQLRGLGLCCDRPDQPGLLSFRGGHHLHTPFQGRLTAPFPDEEILRALHPTPAVAGSPPATAVRAISRIEPFERGWYAGPVGFYSQDETELAVALRCGLWLDNTLSAYAGAGLVAESDPQEEWREIENKMNSFMDALCG